MARLLKVTLIIAAVCIGFVLVAIISVLMFFDPNEFKTQIATAVKDETGRELVIEGDLSLTLFPWIAVEIGRTELGNADGFSANTFLQFDQAKLSVRLLPLILSRRLTVGTASLDGLVVNLEVDRNGNTNWDDLAGSDGEVTESESTAVAGGAVIDVANIDINNANVSYMDGQAGSSFALRNLSMQTGRIVVDRPIDLSAEFDFSSSPGELGGHLAIRGVAKMSDGGSMLDVSGLNVAGTLRGIVNEPTDFNFDARAISVDTAEQSIDAGELDLMLLGLSMAAVVEPFSYADSPQPKAALRGAEFSLKELMQVLDIAPPVTADPDALTRVSFSANAAMTSTALALSGMTLELDDATMTGSLSVPTTNTGVLVFDLDVDEIGLDAYMAPVDEGRAASTDESSSDVEIPVDLIRTLNANGSFEISRAFLSGMEFQNLELGVNASGGNLRLHPLAADFYDGTYRGDVSIDASNDVPTISANETINGVNLAAMAKALFDTDNISGSINGQFVVSGSGQRLSAIQRDLDGTMSFELADGALEGTDVWYQLRKARALFRQQVPPEPILPARTKFSAVTATGVITDGVFQNDDFLAELPFLRLTGAGMVDLVSTEVDYGLQVSVFDRPEFMSGATEAELADFSETVVPLKITGLLSAPKVRPDIEGIYRGRVEEAIEEKKEELKDQLLNRLLGGSNDAPVEGAVDDVAPEEEQEEDCEDQLKKDLLKKLFQ
ncbi:MAG: AsmA family protein [Woeseiaceae bacterium]|nr:AsmA family protein [Woeseiaceae bacterium]